MKAYLLFIPPGGRTSHLFRFNLYQSTRLTATLANRTSEQGPHLSIPTDLLLFFLYHPSTQGQELKISQRSSYLLHTCPVPYPEREETITRSPVSEQGPSTLS